VPGEILIENVSKKFRKRRNRADSIKSLFLGFMFTGMRETYSDFWALRDVTVTIAPGESLGLIGPNGAGKSTLLYLVAGTMPPTTGTVEVKGSVAPMIELGLGFHPELTGRENIYLNSSLYGLTRPEIESIYPDIVAFSELADFIDSPMLSYSNGMRARLAFSIAINLDMDILLVDEALSVGDARFSEKCIGEMFKLKSRRKTILFVSHDLESIELICDRVCFLNQGKVLVEDTPQKAIAEYKAFAHTS
jgi:lipopolysaccharide transport system ATP-binding protein